MQCSSGESPHLCFGIGTEPGDNAVASEFSHLCVKFVSQDDGERHAFLRLICGVAKHQPLQRRDNAEAMVANRCLHRTVHTVHRERLSVVAATGTYCDLINFT